MAIRSMTAKSLVLSLPVLFVACSILGKSSSDSNLSTAAPNPDGGSDGTQCQSGGDCKSGVCDTNAHACVAPVDPDSGTPQCGVSLGGAPCANGQACKVSDDCTSAACVMGVCADPTAMDGVQDGNETDVDCGSGGKGTATNAPACADGKKCSVAADCTSLVCTGGTCQVPTGTDGVKNGNESDVDCGSSGTGENTNAAACALGKTCAQHTDCDSVACDYNNKCVAQKSCTPHHGGDTCGPTGAPENCCTRLPVPGTAVKMDKYNITAGRMRQFVERTGGNMRAFAMGYTGAWWSHNWDQYLPTMLDNGGNTPDDNGGFTGVYQELGPYVHQPGAQGANEGCYVKGNGARSFRLPDAINTRIGDEQDYTQDQDDEKALNCVTAYIVAAFCAWDGGQMPTNGQWDAAWGATLYPWGASPNPAGWANAYPDLVTAQQHTPNVNGTGPGDVTYANWLYNYWSPTEMAGTDYTIFIAQPGRFPKGNSTSGFSDLAASVFNFQDITATITGTNPAAATVTWSKSGSWQGHGVPYYTTTPLKTPASNKYWATGGRCAYTN